MNRGGGRREAGRETGTRARADEREGGEGGGGRERGGEREKGKEGGRGGGDE